MTRNKTASGWAGGTDEAGQLPSSVLNYTVFAPNCQIRLLPLAIQPTEALADALQSVCNALESNRLYGPALLDAFDFADLLVTELRTREIMTLEEAVGLPRQQRKIEMSHVLD